MMVLLEFVRWAADRCERDEAGLVSAEYLKWMIGLLVGLPIVIGLVLAALNALGVDVSSALTRH